MDDLNYTPDEKARIMLEAQRKAYIERLQKQINGTYVSQKKRNPIKAYENYLERNQRLANLRFQESLRTRVWRHGYYDNLENTRILPHQAIVERVVHPNW